MGNKTWLPVCVFSNASGSMEGNVDMIVGRSDPHFDRNSKISTTFEWIAMEVCADIHVPPDYLTYWQFCHFCHITYNSWWNKCKRTLCWDRWKTVLGNGEKNHCVNLTKSEFAKNGFRSAANFTDKRHSNWIQIGKMRAEMIVIVDILWCVGNSTHTNTRSQATFFFSKWQIMLL